MSQVPKALLVCNVSVAIQLYIIGQISIHSRDDIQYHSTFIMPHYKVVHISYDKKLQYAMASISFQFAFGENHINSLLPYTPCLYPIKCLIGLVVEASTLGAEGPEFESHLRQDFFGLSHTSDLKIGTQVATLPGAWYYRVSAGTGRPSVSIL